MHDLRDYLVGGKNLGYLAVAFSARATGESAWLLLGLTGMGAAVGYKALWVVLGEVLGVGLAWALLSRPFKRLTDRYDSITIPDYLESRFRDSAHSLRKIAAIALAIFVTVFVSAQIDATGKAFESFLGWDYTLGAIVGFAVVMAYVTCGGFVAVVWSDIFQGALMVAGLALLPIVALVSIGGVTALHERLATIDVGLLSPLGTQGMSLAGVLSVIGLAGIGLGFLGSPQIFVRFLALRSEREIAPGAAVAVAWTVIADTGAVFTGILGRAIFSRPGDAAVSVLADAEAVLPMLVEHLMPAFLVGLYVAIILAAIMSTVDSLLVLAASAVIRDLYQKIHRPDLADSALVQHSRVATLVLACIALAIALTVAALSPVRTVFWFAIFGWSGIAATFCPLMILSIFWSGTTRRGAIAAMLTGMILVPVFKLGLMHAPGIGPLLVELSELPPAFVASLLVGILVSLGDPAGRERLLREGIANELNAAKN
ncbi:MAG TPA: sodium/proline symporter [Nannocystis exedens]|nr:sodium/proline symporter [Nannocystis exedens]